MRLSITWAEIKSPVFTTFQAMITVSVMQLSESSASFCPSFPELVIVSFCCVRVKKSEPSRSLASSPTWSLTR